MAVPLSNVSAPTRRELRGFAWSVGGAFLVLAAVAASRGTPKVRHPSSRVTKASGVSTPK